MAMMQLIWLEALGPKILIIGSGETFNTTAHKLFNEWQFRHEHRNMGYDDQNKELPPNWLSDQALSWDLIESSIKQYTPHTFEAIFGYRHGGIASLDGIATPPIIIHWHPEL